MQPEPENVPRHESIGHEHPTDAGTMEDDPEHVPGTDVWGDETLVRAVPGGLKLPSSRDVTPAAPKEAGHDDPHGA